MADRETPITNAASDAVQATDVETRRALSGGRTEPSLPDRSFFGHPGGLGALFNTELWERFSYYGMRAILAYYLYGAVKDGGLGIDQNTALAIVSIYGASVYLLTVVGGWLADRLLGQLRASILGGTVIMAGHIFLSVPVSAMSWVGIATVALGSGLQKASITSLVGQLYDPEDGRRDAGFAIFYMSVNVGSLISPFVVGWLKSNYGFHAGFAAAAIGMCIGLIGLVGFRGRLRGAGRLTPNPLEPGEAARLARPFAGIVATLAVVFAVCFTFSSDAPTAVINAITTISILAAIGMFTMMFTSRKVTSHERGHLRAYMPMWLGAVLFWMIFEQAASKMAAFAQERTHIHGFWGLHPDPEWFQSVNAGCVLLFSPLFALIWQKRAGRFPSTGSKFALGVLLAGVSFVLLAWYSHHWALGATAPMWALASVYVVQTVGELCLSPVGTSATSKLAPVAFATQGMALWYLTSAVGQSLGAQAIRLMAGLSDTTFYLTLGIIALAFSVVLAALVPWIHGHIKDVDDRVATTLDELVPAT